MATDNEKAAIVVGGGVGAGALLLRRKAGSTPPPPPPPGGDDTLTLLRQIVALSQRTVDSLEAIFDLIAANVIPNADTVLSLHFQCSIAGQAYQLPSLPVPDGFSLLLKNAPDNGVGTLIYVSPSSGGAVNRGSSWVLVRNEPYTVRIKNASELWVSSTVLNQFVDLAIEQRK